MITINKFTRIRQVKTFIQVGCMAVMALVLILSAYGGIVSDLCSKDTLTELERAEMALNCEKPWYKNL